MMRLGSGRLVVSLGIASVYFLITCEILFMILPFAVYFYSVYGPVLEFLSSHPLTGWSTEFFLPHMVFTKDPLIVGISYLQVLFIVGMLMFLISAIPLYYTRIFKKTIARRGPYSRIRHPQYLSLAIAGFGLLLYWPRFIILVSYVTMLFVYYLLARNEEWRMAKRFGPSYEEYMRNTPMFIPGEPGGRLYRRFLGRIGPKWLGITLVYVVALSLSLGIAYGLREYSSTHIQKISAGEVTIIPVFSRPDAEVLSLYQAVTDRAEVRGLLTEGVNLVYLMPGDFFLSALLIEEPRKFSDELIARFPEILEWHRYKFGGTVGRFFRIFYNYLQALGAANEGYEVERLIFVAVKDGRGNTVGPDSVFGIGLERTAVALVDIDATSHELLVEKKLSGLHKWGKIPMPVF